MTDNSEEPFLFHIAINLL